MCLGTTSLGRLKFLSFGKRRVLEFEEIETQRRIGRGEGTPIRMRPRIGTPTIFKNDAFPPLKVLFFISSSSVPSVPPCFKLFQIIHKIGETARQSERSALKSRPFRGIDVT